MARRVYGLADVNQFHSGTYYPGPNSFDAARRNAKLQQKFARRSRYGKSFGSLYNKYTKALVEDDDRAGGIYGAQIVNRLNDGFYGRGRYRRRSYRRRRTYRRRRYRGRGMYMGGRGNYATRFKRFRKQVSGAASQIKTPLDQMLPGAAAIGSLVAGPEAGAAIMGAGSMASEGLGILEGPHNSKMAGRGMYVGGRGSYSGVSGNSLIEGLGTTVPNFSTSDTDHGDLMVAHSEFVSDIIGNEWGEDNNGQPIPLSTFDMRTISLNPALSKSFPFLSQIAQNFEEYEFIQMIFSYKPKVSNNLSSSDGQVGSVMMYTDYNSNDDPKRSKQQILQAYGHSSDMITKCILHGVECDPAQLAGDGHHFTRVKPPTGTNNDYNDFDAGLFQLVVANTPAALSNQVIGELWVSYNVKLKKARTFSVYGLGIDRDEMIAYNVMGGYGRNTSNVPLLGKWNSIGATYEILSVPDQNSTLGDAEWNPILSNSALVQITLPQSFSGDLRIDMTATKPLGQSGSIGATEFLYGRILRPIIQGNMYYLHVSPMDQEHEDVYTHTATTPPVGSEEIMLPTNRAWHDIAGDNVLGDPSSATDNNTTASQVYHQVLYVHVEMAERAIDNTIWMSVPVFDGYYADVLLQMQRWNAREATVPDPSFQD